MPALRCDVVLEQTLGHVSHSQNLQRLMPAVAEFEPTFFPIAYELDGWARHVPGYGNWTIRSGVRTRRALRGRAGDRDALFVHTQVPAVLLGRAMAKTPTVVSLDATPRQLDQLGTHYGHAIGSARVERWKAELNRRCFERAAHLVAWAAWTKQGLVDDYGVDDRKVTVVSPGVDLEQWRPPPGRMRDDEHPLTILFVGGDLRRKGGDGLIAACRRLRDDSEMPSIELHLVTGSEVPEEPGVFVHRGLKPNSRELIELYERADIFCLPTLGDCLPMVLAEAAASGLPIIATDVGGISEIVQPGVNGDLINPGDAVALERAIRRLAREPDLRARYGIEARRLAERSHDAGANAARLVEILRSVAVGSAARPTRST